MKSVKLKKVFHLESNEEVNFSKGILLIDDKGPTDNWTVSLSKVKNTEVFTEAEDSQENHRLQLFDIEDNSYQGTLAADRISRDGTILMKSMGELNKA
ncbi:hypothetical protein [Halobacillus campisalis]|uniref:Uncharacterized protein n=1 Tax=Halobacillus campisalis TaxID=435909 RepID=A0ABW2K6E7_9BACI|nr:hypothetical protein [Halobacillus campisalis]